MTNKPNGTLYIGVTRNLLKRVLEHKGKVVHGFTSKYDLTKLVYFEEVEDRDAAINREKQLKNWHREWKISLITEHNPNWIDLFNKLI